MYGTQALFFRYPIHETFENDVKMYGTQAQTEAIKRFCSFENDVKMYGTQACEPQRSSRRYV